jgi:tetratricopeptide (TPR) repeat protein
LAPALAEAQFSLGNLLADQGEWVAAIEAFRAAVAARPDFTAAWHNLGDSLQAQGDLAGALEAYRRVMRQTPEAFARIVNTLAAHAHGTLWLDFAALRRDLLDGPG